MHNRWHLWDGFRNDGGSVQPSCYNARGWSKYIVTGKLHHTTNKSLMKYFNRPTASASLRRLNSWCLYFYRIANGGYPYDLDRRTNCRRGTRFA
jgi:hypothetical protein